MSLRVYVAGPMRGLPNYNFGSFDAARDFLRRLGHDPISPADMDREWGYVTEENGVIETTDQFSIGYALRHDFIAICSCDAISFLPGWESSSGSLAERQVASLIQLPMYRVDPYAATFERELIVGFSGYARAGKDTAAKVLVDRAHYVRHGFADALKDMLYGLNPIVNYSPTVRVQPIVDTSRWERAKSNIEIRELLQRLGTEAGRNVLGPNVWVDTLFNRATEPRIVIPDVRFPNEAEAIKARGGLVIRIEREGVGPANNHPSETALDGFEFDAIVCNDGTIEDLADSLTWLVQFDPQRDALAASA